MSSKRPAGCLSPSLTGSVTVTAPQAGCLDKGWAVVVRLALLGHTKHSRVATEEERTERGLVFQSASQPAVVVVVVVAGDEVEYL